MPTRNPVPLASICGPTSPYAFHAASFCAGRCGSGLGTGSSFPTSPHMKMPPVCNPIPRRGEEDRGVLHELLSLSVMRRMTVPAVGSFCEEYQFSNAFASNFTRHPGIFYVSLKGGIKTAVLREAYDEHGELVDWDPFLEIKDKFVQLMDEGHREWRERVRSKAEALRKDLVLMASKDAELYVGGNDAEQHSDLAT
ncbi:hypothetical protein HPP92_002692 [Vanilla planifolia]|uniref:PORR domain-containing protein n=1 Tax=Vanilla planifolia TaxID=51239 RepID=A0A835S0S5_VANPL|nr:hypothetical protein HPP92_002692 [Vanilla planifolia]